MEVQVTFDAESYTRCKLVLRHEDGSEEQNVFPTAGMLVDYCKERGIVVAVEDCVFGEV